MPKKYTPKGKLDVSEKEWAKIKTEYITTETSYRALAEKYGLTYTRLHTRGRNEGWAEEREAYKENLVKKSLELISDEQAERIARAIRIGDTMLQKVEESLAEIDYVVTENSYTEKYVDKNSEGVPCEITSTKKDYAKKRVAIDRAGLRQLSAVLKDLREIGIFRSEMDKKEQEARIRKLQKDAEDEQKDTTITVQFASDIEEYGD